MLTIGRFISHVVLPGISWALLELGFTDGLEGVFRTAALGA
jgi:hypothetical protein